MAHVTSVVAVLAEKEGETQGWTSNTETVCIENSVQFAVWGLDSFTRQRNHRSHQVPCGKCLMGYANKARAAHNAVACDTRAS